MKQRIMFFARTMKMSEKLQAEQHCPFLIKDVEMSIELTGKVMGSVRTHTEETLKKVFDKAYTVIQLPEGELYEGELDQLKGEMPKRPIVLFMHGSSGINPAIRTFAKHLYRQQV